MTMALLTALGGALFALDLRAAPAPAAAADPGRAEAVDPKSKEALARMSAYLKTLDAFTVRAETSKDELVDGDFKAQKSATVTLSVRRPDGLRAEVSGDDGDRVFVYDGKTLVVHARTENYYATMPAPPTIREALDAAEARHGVELPLLDLLYAATGDDLGSGVVAAGDIGPSRVAGCDCEHYAFRGKNVDWQLWIERGDRPLPRKIVITTKDDPTRPQYAAVLTWDLSPRFDAATFTFSPPKGAMPIAFEPRGAAGGEGQKPGQKKR